MKTYLVLGVYTDNLQRYADSFRAKTVAGAEKQALDQAKKRGEPVLIIAAVLLDGVVVG